MSMLEACGMVTLLAALGAVGARSTSAQTVNRLTEPDAAFEESFGLVGGVRELPDRRVMVADPLGQALVVLDMERGVADTLGRIGQGPEEYRQPDAVFALPGDSTLLVDLGNGRLTVLGPDGSFGATEPIMAGRPGPGMQIRIPRAVDGRGRLYFQSFGGAMRPGAPLPTTAPIMRWDRASDAVDTVGQVLLPARSRSSSGGPDNQRQEIQPIPLSPADGWSVAGDGLVAVARAEGGYRVDWIQPDGTMREGSPVPFDPVRIGRAEKEEWAERSSQAGGGLSIGIRMENGQMSAAFSRGGTSERPDLDRYEWPEVKPPFVPGAVRTAPDGTVWVQREQPAGQPPLFDVFGPDGGLRAQVEAPARRRLAGFGEGTVYLVRTDDFDLQYLERYRMP